MTIREQKHCSTIWARQKGDKLIKSSTIIWHFDSFSFLKHKYQIRKFDPNPTVEQGFVQEHNQNEKKKRLWLMFIIWSGARMLYSFKSFGNCISWAVRSELLSYLNAIPSYKLWHNIISFNGEYNINYMYYVHVNVCFVYIDALIVFSCYTLLATRCQKQILYQCRKFKKNTRQIKNPK